MEENNNDRVRTRKRALAALHRGITMAKAFAPDVGDLRIVSLCLGEAKVIQSLLDPPSAGCVAPIGDPCADDIADEAAVSYRQMYEESGRDLALIASALGIEAGCTDVAVVTLRAIAELKKAAAFTAPAGNTRNGLLTAPAGHGPQRQNLPGLAEHLRHHATVLKPLTHVPAIREHAAQLIKWADALDAAAPSDQI